MSVIQESFGRMADGREVTAFTLENENGASARVIGYGAIVQSLRVPDREGRLDDVVLGYDTLEDYVASNPYFGAIVGRFGNRIQKGRFELDGVWYQVDRNEGENHLHGGKEGFDKKVWELGEAEAPDGPAVLAVLDSLDGDMGYPGRLRLEVLMVLTEDSALRLEYTGTTNRPTILNPTHHSYFNLTGDFGNTILDHVLQINADHFTPVDRNQIPTGAIDPVAGTPLDFQEPKPVGRDIDLPDEQTQIGGGYDHNFVLREYREGRVRQVATLRDPQSGRVMTVHSDQPGLQLYSGNFLDGTLRGKGGMVHGHRTGICLEAQHHPDAPNKLQFPSVVLRPGEVYRQVTSYGFGIEP